MSSAAGRILLICGSSGVGKGSVVQRILSRYPDAFELSVSATTRKIRSGEVHGKHYYFNTKEEFEQDIKSNSLLEWVQFDNNYYGTKKSVLADIEKRKKVNGSSDRSLCWRSRFKAPCRRE